MIYKKTYYYFKSALSHKLCDDIIKCGFSENPNIALTGNRKPRNKIEHSCNGIKKISYIMDY